MIYGLLKQNRNNSFLQLGGGKGVVGSQMEIFCFKADNLTGRFFSDKGILLHVIYLKKTLLYTKLIFLTDDKNYALDLIAPLHINWVVYDILH